MQLCIFLVRLIRARGRHHLVHTVLMDNRGQQALRGTHEDEDEDQRGVFWYTTRICIHLRASALYFCILADIWLYYLEQTAIFLTLVPGLSRARVSGPGSFELMRMCGF